MKFMAIFLLLGHAYGLSKLRDIKWKVLKDKGGITVYEPINYKHPSGLIPLKFKASLNHDISKVLSVLSDDKRKTEWMPNLKESKVVERKSLEIATVYYRYDAPWPFNDRVFVVTNNAVFTPENMTINVDIRSVQHENAPLTKNHVRGITYDGYSVIKPGKVEGTTEVEMAFLNDFGGLLPSFIVNLVQRQWPYKFMFHLREQLLKNDIVINPAFIYKPN